MLNKHLSVLMVLRQFYPIIGGAEMQAQRIASQLILSGIETNVVTGRFERKVKRKEYVEKILVIRLPSPRIRFLGTIIYLGYLVCYLIKNHKKYNIVHCHIAGYATLVCVMMEKILGFKTVLTIASGARYGNMKGEIFQLQSSFMGRRFLQVIRKVDVVTAMTPQIHQHLFENGFPEHKIVDIPGGVDIAKFKPSDRKGLSDQKRIIFTGRLAPEKGLDILLKALARINTKNRHLLIHGEGPLKNSLLEMAENLGISNYVTFIGPTDKVAEYLARSDLFVLPSYFEGLSVALLEAMATGLPVVATKISGNMQLIQEGVNGLLVEPGNPDELARAIEEIINNSQLAKEMGKANRQKISAYYSIDNMIDKYTQLYQRLLS